MNLRNDQNTERRKSPRPDSKMSILWAMRSWRTLSVTLLSFSSGLPLGLVLIAIPDWMRSAGIDIRIVGLVTLAQAPWAFKILWSPFMDRFAPPFWGRRRGWMAITQVLLFALTLVLAGLGSHPDAPWVIGAVALAIAFASASQDIVLDAYAVEVLRAEEQGVAVGARVAFYRAAMFVAGGLSITLAGRFSWSTVCVMLACIYLLMIFISKAAPEPEETLPPPTSMREAVWLPFVGFLSKHRALEILAFVFFYKIADNLAGALLRPFLIDLGYNSDLRGVALAGIAVIATLAGTFLGGILTTVLGLGHALWIFGIIQIFSNLGYVLLARYPDVAMAVSNCSGLCAIAHAPRMCLATGFENLTSGMGTGAFGVLLLRITQKRFSATQYALFSSLFAVPRLVAGPISGFTVYAIGWEPFLWLTMFAGIPGLVLLHRFAPLGTRDPQIYDSDINLDSKPGSRGLLIRWGLLIAIPMFFGSAAFSALLTALRALKDSPERSFDFLSPFASVLTLSSRDAWITCLACLTVAVISGLFASAVVAARRSGMKS